MYRMQSGKVVISGDWRPFRDAIERAMKEEGIEKEVSEDGSSISIPSQVWNIGCIAILHYLDAHKRTCGDCKKVLEAGEDIRCLDCRWLMCPGCAERHFWPNGRPKEGAHAKG
jgi:hypothetical protein